MTVKVADWVSGATADGKQASVGGLGGWFDDGHRWPDYLATWDESVHPYLEAVKNDVLASGRFLTGEQHQEDSDGVPLFDDGTVGVFSWRGWGDLMAAIATEKDGKDHHYIEFYMVMNG